MLHDQTGSAPADVAARAAAADRLLIGCDFDGTMSPIVGRPDQARPLPGAMPALIGLAALPRTHVAVISGRARQDLAGLVGRPPGVLLIGSHGAEWGSDFGEAIPSEQARLLREVTRRAQTIVAGVPGAIIEQKPASVAVHVRQATRADAERVLAALLDGPASTPGVAAIHGKEVLELSVATADKGTAIVRLREMFGPTLTLFLGDDTTDEAAFAELSESDIGIKVGQGPSLASVRIGDPGDTVLLLAALLLRRRAAGSGGR